MRLTVAGDMEIGTSSGDYHRFRIGGGNSDGFLYGSYPGLGDGIHMGYNWYADATGTGQTVNLGGQTSRISTGYGVIALATGGVDEAPIDRMIVDQAGNVKIGPGTSYYVPAGEENLRIIRGVINAVGGTIVGLRIQRDPPVRGALHDLLQHPIQRGSGGHRHRRCRPIRRIRREHPGRNGELGQI